MAKMLSEPDLGIIWIDVMFSYLKRKPWSLNSKETDNMKLFQLSIACF